MLSKDIDAVLKEVEYFCNIALSISLIFLAAP